MDMRTINGVSIILNVDLLPTQMKEKGFINGVGKEIVTEVEVGIDIYNHLKLSYFVCLNYP